MTLPLRTLVIVTLAAAASGAHPARACGGLFCSQTSPTPVDQSAEKILFEVREDGSVTATVEIKYNGDPRDFSWIVPVSGQPAFVEVAAKDELLLLDQASRPTLIPPSSVCSNPPFSPSFGCQRDALATPLAGEQDGGPGGLDVTAYPSVGPFDDIVVVSGANPDILMGWLQEHGYQVTAAMRPFINAYTLEGYSFLATRLQADATVQDMVPIRFHCPQPNPEIPLRLTAIAAEPDMAFLVFVAGPERYTLFNYAEVPLGVDELQVDANSGRTNYFALISKKIDDAGGRGFVVERANTALSWKNAIAGTFLGTDGEQAARDAANALLARQQFVTRFYGRMDATEMTEDPIFISAGHSTPFTAFDLSSRVYDACPASGTLATFAPAAPRCGTVYCGDGDACAVDETGVEGCVCRDTHVARTTTAPTGGVQVACIAPEIDVHGAAGDPCAGNSCGPLGTCLPVNDRPTCDCGAGAVAVLQAEAAVTCKAIAGATYESDQILWPQRVLPGSDPPGGCTSSPAAGARAGGALSLALLFGAAAAVRRALRRS